MGNTCVIFKNMPSSIVKLCFFYYHVGYIKHTFKCILLGERNVGKSSIFFKYFKIDPSDYPVRFGPYFQRKNIVIDNYDIELIIWNGIRIPRFSRLEKSIWKSADIAILVYDVSNKQSFKMLDKYMDELKNRMDDAGYVTMGIAANKYDLMTDKHVVHIEEAMQYAESKNALLFETSAKT